MPPPKKRPRRHRRSWSDLPHDLLSVILDQLTPCFGDRVRFRGVCQAWRAAEVAHPRPPMPWLVAPGHCVSLHDASIYRVPLPEDAAAAVCRGTLGDWLALVPPTSGRRPFLLNVVTMERIKLPRWSEKKPMVKLVLSSAPDSKSCTVAAIAEYTLRTSISKIVVCSPMREQRRERSWRTITRAFELHDIIFFEGKLHAIDAEGRVHVFQDGDLQGDQTWRPPEPPYIAGWQLNFSDYGLHLVVLHGRLLMVARAFGDTRVPDCTHFTSAVGVFTPVLGGGDTVKWPQPVKDLGGHAIFVGDACCDAFAVGSGGGKIRENQICFVDDEKSLSLLATYCLRPFRQLQSYDVPNDCLRTYRPWPSSEASGTWRCVTAQRFPHSRGMGPLLRKAPPEAELRLWDMNNCLGATYEPLYRTHKGAGGAHVTVSIDVPTTAAIRNNRVWSFRQRAPSAREARQAAAHEAATFLRSRFRSVLDDSPWSSVPHYHSHIEEEEEEEEEAAAAAAAEETLSSRDLFRWKRWYGGC